MISVKIRKVNKMKKLTVLLIVLFVIIILIGCGEGNYEQEYTGNEQHVVADIGLFGADRHYDVQSFNLDINLDFRQFHLFNHQERLYLLMLTVDEDTLNSYIHLLHMDVDGTNIQEVYYISLDENIDIFNILGFEKHDDGYATLVSTDSVILPPYTREEIFDGLWEFDIVYSYVYRRISPYGEILSVFGIKSLNNDKRQIAVSDLAFDLGGNAIVSVSWLPSDFELLPGQWMIPEGVGGQSFFLFNNGLTGDFHELENTTLSTGLFNRISNGRIITSSFVGSLEIDQVTYYEIDFDNIAIIDGSVIKAEAPINSINGVFLAPQISVFDYYLIGNYRELIGYHKFDGSFTTIIDFLELGVPLDRGIIDRNNFILWDDGRIIVVDWTWNASLRREEPTLFLLTPNDESSSTAIEREIITLGGVDVVGSPLIDQVAIFNFQNDTHQIEILNYHYYEIDRLRAEFITGGGPDMFKLSWWNTDFVTALSEGHFMLDLYQKIDADPDLNREDFFLNILSAWENSRGELVQIAPSFMIQTIIGMQSVFPEAPVNWNYADFITFYQQARIAGYSYPFGQTIDRLQILIKLLYADNTFFCERTAVANFNSESFINVLDFVMTIPADQGWDRVLYLIQEGQWDPVGNLLKGEQLLLPFTNITSLTEFRHKQARLGGITAFGFPSSTSPTHVVSVGSGTAIGIRSNSPHTEVAWEFVRSDLLPDVIPDEFSFPLRVDLFEQLVYGTVSEYAVFGGVAHTLPPMVEADVELIRELVLNIGHAPISYHPVQNIVNEDVQAFFAGVRSAEDTARIIQSRVQRLLDERER